MSLLESKNLNGWRLLYWIAGVNSVAVIAYSATQDLSGPSGVSEMIQMSVRCTVPLLYLVFVASALNVVAPGTFSRWLLRNRRYFGLSYAATMCWQLVFILWMWAAHWEYYTEEVYDLEDIIFQAGGYLIIFAMTITSFLPVRRKMTLLQWQVLHKTGIYWLWYTVTSTYVYEIFVYEDQQILDYFYMTAGVLVYLLRLAAWLQSRSVQTATPQPS